jgi:hypothetical protein
LVSATHPPLQMYFKLILQFSTTLHYFGSFNSHNRCKIVERNIRFKGVFYKYIQYKPEINNLIIRSFDFFGNSLFFCYGIFHYSVRYRNILLQTYSYLSSLTKQVLLIFCKRRTYEILFSFPAFCFL